jgi:beta-1,4-mannosyl-glycoprotein beta-1,4-N-acetylglucosaminyltransferase
MVFDAFLFYNELDLLDIRLNILDPHVDFFVINEATITFSGKEKPLYFSENKSRYSAFKDKIIHTVIDDTPSSFSNWRPGEYQWGREIFQRESLLRGLNSCASNDMIILSDVDEIPNPQAIQSCRQNIKETDIYILEQRMYYYYLNCLKLNETWLGSKICTYNQTKNGLNNIRSIKTGQHIPEGGWHFSFLGGIEKIKQKLEAYSHQEFNNDRVKNNLEVCISQNKDILGRPVEFRPVPIDSTFPEYITKNIDKYSDLIKPV